MSIPLHCIYAQIEPLAPQHGIQLDDGFLVRVMIFYLVNIDNDMGGSSSGGRSMCGSKGAK